MNDFETLLDTPRKQSLQTQSGTLRAALKEFERAFAEYHGRKPKPVDIKNDLTIAAKYKEYQKVQDVLAGKIAYEKLLEASPQKKNKQRHNRVNSGIGSSPQKRRSLYETPRKGSKAHEPDARSSASPKPILLNAIGPTPHRDGQVLGLFDLLQKSGSEKGSSTPSSSARKRKIEELYSDTPAQRYPLKVIRTPSQRPSKKQGDILDFLNATPQKSSSNQESKKHSRTPQSDGKKFALSQLFATPSTQRFLFAAQEELRTAKRTSPSDLRLGLTPQREPDKTGLDATPVYLRRSTSFKDRLLSATAPPAANEAPAPAPPFKSIGPPTLRHFRSSTNNVFKISNIPETARGKVAEKHDEHDDDLEALREIEGGAAHRDILVEDSQFGVPTGMLIDSDGEAQPVTVKPYKKKGQKRTTRKSNIRPVTQKKAKEPRFVAADDSDGDAEEGNADEIVDETQFSDVDGGSDFAASDIEAVSPVKKRQRSKVEQGKIRTKEMEDKKKSKKRQPGMINPNAQSHMNFRSLKIKNKNSKAGGAGRGRFGKGRR